MGCACRNLSLRDDFLKLTKIVRKRFVLIYFHPQICGKLLSKKISRIHNLIFSFIDLLLLKIYLMTVFFDVETGLFDHFSKLLQIVFLMRNQIFKRIIHINRLIILIVCNLGLLYFVKPTAGKEHFLILWITFFVHHLCFLYFVFVLVCLFYKNKLRFV